MQGIARIGPGLDGKQTLVRRIHEPWGTGQGGGPAKAVLVRQPHDHEWKQSEERPMLLRHVVPNNRAPSEFDALTYAGKTLNLLLAGVKGRRGACHGTC